MKRFAELVKAGRYVKCLSFIHDIFLPALESEMDSIIDALAIYEEKSE